MAWMGELLNHLGISKSFVSAIFVTSIALLGGPIVLPDTFEPLDGLLRTGTLAAAIFSFTLIVAWVLPPTIQAITSLPSNIINSTFFNPPNEAELLFLKFLGEKSPNEWVSFDSLNHKENSLIRLIEVCRTLEKKKLVLVGGLDSSVLITAKGRRYVLKQIEKQET